jgi:hypothetical protein
VCTGCRRPVSPGYFSVNTWLDARSLWSISWSDVLDKEIFIESNGKIVLRIVADFITKAGWLATPNAALEKNLVDAKRLSAYNRFALLWLSFNGQSLPEMPRKSNSDRN